MINAIRHLRMGMPVVFYMVSDECKPGSVYKLPNEQARAGFDLLCHPDTVDAMLSNAPSDVLLILMTDAERDRRTRMFVDKITTSTR